MTVALPAIECGDAGEYTGIDRKLGMARHGDDGPVWSPAGVRAVDALGEDQSGEEMALKVGPWTGARLDNAEPEASTHLSVCSCGLGGWEVSAGGLYALRFYGRT